MIRSDRVHQRDRAAAGYTDVAINEQEGAPERSWLACLWRAGSLATGCLQTGDSREHGSVCEGSLGGHRCKFRSPKDGEPGVVESRTGQATQGSADRMMFAHAEGRPFPPSSPTCRPTPLQPGTCLASPGACCNLCRLPLLGWLLSQHR